MGSDPLRHPVFHYAHAEARGLTPDGAFPMTKSLVQQQFGAHAAAYATSSVHAKGASLGRLVELDVEDPSQLDETVIGSGEVVDAGGGEDRVEPTVGDGQSQSVTDDEGSPSNLARPGRPPRDTGSRGSTGR